MSSCCCKAACCFSACCISCCCTSWLLFTWLSINVLICDIICVSMGCLRDFAPLELFPLWLSTCEAYSINEGAETNDRTYCVIWRCLAFERTLRAGVVLFHFVLALYVLLHSQIPLCLERTPRTTAPEGNSQMFQWSILTTSVHWHPGPLYCWLHWLLFLLW